MATLDRKSRKKTRKSNEQNVSHPAIYNQSYLLVIMIDHDIVRLDISVHDAHTVTVVQCLQQATIQCLSQELRKVRHMSHQAEKGETHVSPS